MYCRFLNVLLNYKLQYIIDLSCNIAEKEGRNRILPFFPSPLQATLQT